MNIDVKNINAGKLEVQRAIAHALHDDFFAQTLPVNFNLHIHSQSDAAPRLTAVLLIPDEDIAREFLEDYGGETPSRTVVVGGRALVFSPSVEVPSKQIIDYLRSKPYLDPAAVEERRVFRKNVEAYGVQVDMVQFGWECQDGVFSVEYEIPCEASLVFELEKREFKVKINGPDRLQFIGIRASQIICAYHGEEDDSGDNVLLLSLQHSPTYGSKQRFHQSRSWKRTTSLGNQHNLYTAYTARSLRLVCGETDAYRKVGHLCKIAQLKTYDHLHPIEWRGLFSQYRQTAFKDWLYKLPFDVAFQIEGMTRENVVDLQEVLTLRTVVEDMQNQHGIKYTASFLQSLTAELKTHPAEPFGIAFDRFRQVFSPPDPESRGDDTFPCFHVEVTPTTFHLRGPFPERSNRVIRQYVDDTSQFIRVSFLEEGRVHYRFDREMDGRTFIRQRVGGILTKGLYIAGNHFEFLAYSQSGLKSHAMWFIQPFDVEDNMGNVEQVNAASIIAGLGDFAHDQELIRCPARYAARISQAFTTTDAAVTMEPEEIFPLDDIYDDTGKRSFTDGVGTLSPELAQEIWDELQEASPRRFKRGRPCPRAFQIRCAGSKGMLSVNYKLSGRAMCLRRSMTKFESAHRQIEIATVADSPGGFFLNRPLIMLLEGLKAKGGYPYFKKLQDDVIKDTKESTRSLDTAARLLEGYGLGASFRLTSVLLGIFKLGFPTLNDAFIHEMLNFSVHHILRDLKYHARIPVPGGWTLVGVADIHGQLKEGEVFARVVPAGTRQPIYLEGRMLIARSPVIDPGDIQVVHAIGRPPRGSPLDIEPLTNTIVFSIQGERPLASCLAGGDLDGDCYVCTTVEEMIPTETYDPADYDPARRYILDYPSTVHDIADFIVEYIYSDNIGIIASKWLATADRSPEGIFDPECLNLAALHSDATDYPKTGMPVSLSGLSGPTDDRPDWSRPEVGLRSDTLFYESHRWLGKLYREVELPKVDPLPKNASAASDRAVTAVGAITASEVKRFIRLNASQSALETVLLRTICPYIPTDESRPDDIESGLALLRRYTQTLQIIAANHSLFREPLREAEIVIGTIAAKSSQPRVRKETMSQMREQATNLVGEVREGLSGTHEGDEEDIMHHLGNLRLAWTAYKISTMRPALFGSRSFGLLALGEILDSVKHIEDAWRSQA